ncbi:protein AMN1 homolog isoform X2 [Haliotis rufescens]|uniref:protein AMN1 homolog isoform X2 n=1 Tax=Haliotis rufescens TaxID=6454 RepID=UPI001EB058EA|nr:protein AMN1 homolog isoform X2 [Haliotis rufescens]
MASEKPGAFTDSMMFPTVPSLLDSSVKVVVLNLDSGSDLESLPLHIKDKCLTLMCKRGIISDSNIRAVLHNRLQKLDLSESEVTDAGLANLSKCPQLKKIDLNSIKESRTAVTTQGITALSQYCHQLQVVYVRRCVNLTDDALIALSQNCPQLRDLNIGGCPNITDRTLTALGQYSHFLKSLNFSRANEIHMDHCKHLTDESVEAITQFCPQINILIFHGCPLITEQARMALEELTVGRTSQMKHVTWTIY